MRIASAAAPSAPRPHLLRGGRKLRHRPKRGMSQYFSIVSRPSARTMKCPGSSLYTPEGRLAGQCGPVGEHVMQGLESSSRGMSLSVKRALISEAKIRLPSRTV